jgi:hypothetical protein
MYFTHLSPVIKKQKNWFIRVQNPDLSDPIVFLTVVVITSGHLYDDFLRLFFLTVHREASVLFGELSEDSWSDQFLFLHVDCMTYLTDFVGLMLHFHKKKNPPYSSFFLS